MFSWWLPKQNHTYTRTIYVYTTYKHARISKRGSSRVFPVSTLYLRHLRLPSGPKPHPPPSLEEKKRSPLDYHAQLDRLTWGHSDLKPKIDVPVMVPENRRTNLATEADGNFFRALEADPASNYFLDFYHVRMMIPCMCMYNWFP